MVLLPGCKCCKSGPCWRCYAKYDLPDNCGELPDACVCDGKEYSIPDTFKGVLTYDSIEYNPASSLAESEVDFSQLQELLNIGTAGITFTRATLYSLISSEFASPSRWLFTNSPDGSVVPERCGDFSGNITSVPFIDLGCSGTVKGKFNLMEYYDTIQPDSNGFGFVSWEVSPSEPVKYSICGSEVLTIIIEGGGGATINDCSRVIGSQNYMEAAVYSLVNAKFTFTIPLIIEGQSGACCLPTGDCSITTHQECADQCGIWTQNATCEDNPCVVIEPEEYKCFDAQPEEEGWVATGDCSATEAECAESCGPCWRCYTDGTDYECVGPEGTPKDGWLPVGDCHASEEECAESCGPPPDPSCCARYDDAQRQTYSPLGYSLYKYIEQNPISIGDPFPGSITGTLYSGPSVFCSNIVYPMPNTNGLSSVRRYEFTTPGGNISPDREYAIIECNLECESVMGCEMTFKRPDNAGNSKVSFRLKFGGFAQDFRYDQRLYISDRSPVSSGGGLQTAGFIKSNFANISLGYWNDSKQGTSILGYYYCEGEPGPISGRVESDTAWVKQEDFSGVLTVNWKTRDEIAYPDAEEIETIIDIPGLYDSYCDVCSHTLLETRTMTTTKTTGGPGTELKRLLGSFGIQSKEKGCGCRSMQKKMDQPGWAVSHKEEIINHLAAEAKKRRLPFIRLAAEKLVDLAIRRAEK